MLDWMRRRPALRILLLVLIGTGSSASLFTTAAHSAVRHEACDAAAADDHGDAHGPSHQAPAAAATAGPVGTAWQLAGAEDPDCQHCAPGCAMAGHCGGVTGIVRPAAPGSRSSDTTADQPDVAARLRSLTVPPPTPPPHIVA